MSKKKKIVLIVIATLLVGAYACFWAAAQIHNHYNPPVPGNSAEGIQNFYKMQIEQQKNDL